VLPQSDHAAHPPTTACAQSHLKDQPDLQPHRREFIFIKLIDALAGEVDRPLVGSQKANDVLEHHALAAAAGTHHHRCLALFKRKRDAIKHNLRAKTLVNVLEPHNGIAVRLIALRRVFRLSHSLHHVRTSLQFAAIPCCDAARRC
jgi:hypothetical protein